MLNHMRGSHVTVVLNLELECGVVILLFFFFSSRRRHTIFDCDWSSDVCSSDLFLRATGLIRSGCNGCGQRFRWKDLTCGQAKPVFKARLAEWRAIAWKECVLAKLHAVVERMRVRDNVSRILSCG